MLIKTYPSEPLPPFLGSVNFPPSPAIACGIMDVLLTFKETNPPEPPPPPPVSPGESCPLLPLEEILPFPLISSAFIKIIPPPLPP